MSKKVLPDWIRLRTIVESNALSASMFGFGTLVFGFELSPDGLASFFGEKNSGSVVLEETRFFLAALFFYFLANRVLFNMCS